MVSGYPYTRADECSWQPEEAARRLGALLPSSSSAPPLLARGDGYDPLARADAGGESDPHAISTGGSNLLTRGRGSGEVRALRAAYGSNALHGDDVDEPSQAAPSFYAGAKKRMQAVLPIVGAFYDQLKEPLILMLLCSAAISLFLGNSADAVSIALALSIVSLVAAVQEYRSEKGEFCNGGHLDHSCPFAAVYCKQGWNRG